MNTENAFEFIIDRDTLTVTVKRDFDAPVDLVWEAWTNAEILDQWWGPHPWRAETKSMDFSEGGRWLYAMVGPQGERPWDLETFVKIDPLKSFSLHNAFCDEHGVATPGAPTATWENTFVETAGRTLVTNIIRYETLDSLEEHIKMGFKEGYTLCLDQLKDLLHRLSRRRQQA